MSKLNIALIAHDKMKTTMVGFCFAYQRILKDFGLYTTGTTGKRIEEGTDLVVTRLASGPLGGDQQIGSMIVTQDIDLVIFLRDPLTAQPHETDIQALIRLCDVHQIPVATNLASAEIFIHALQRGELNWRQYRKTEHLQ
ncbi:MAG TPA: methylglyoxal synthase [Firmicutes bacterium]|nr:methylglyoxal synthase [Bacillota bacterium]